MKFSFDAQSYRNNLAKDLVEKRKESKDDAKQFLGKEKESDTYILSKDIKRISYINEKMKKPDSIIELNETEKKDINNEYEIHSFDISKIIPKNVQKYFDIIRMRIIKNEIQAFPVEGKYYKSFYEDEDALDRFEKFKNGLDYDLWDELGIDLYEKIANQEDNSRAIIRKETEYFIDELTDGAFYNPEMLNHIVEADYKNDALQSEKRFPYVDKNSNIIQENCFETNNVSLSGLWFSAGGSDIWFDPTKVVVICDSKGSRIRDQLKTLHGYANECADKSLREWTVPGLLPMEERLEKAMDVARKNTVGGIYMGFKEKRTWEEIADWIIDLYHGKVHKITRKTNENPTVEKLEILNPDKDSETEKKLRVQNLTVGDVDTRDLIQLEKNNKFENGVDKKDLDFFYMRAPEFQGTNFKKDLKNKIEEIKRKIEENKINKKQECAKIFNCQAEQIALSKEEINTQTVVFGGDISLDDGSIKLCDNLKYITGSLSFVTEDKSNNFLKELCYVGKNLYINFDEVSLIKLERIGGNLIIERSSGKFPDNLKYIGGNLYAREYHAKLPKDIKNTVKGRIRWSIENYNKEF